MFRCAVFVSVTAVSMPLGRKMRSDCMSRPFVRHHRGKQTALSRSTVAQAKRQEGNGLAAPEVNAGLKPVWWGTAGIPTKQVFKASACFKTNRFAQRAARPHRTVLFMPFVQRQLDGGPRSCPSQRGGGIIMGSSYRKLSQVRQVLQFAISIQELLGVFIIVT